VKKYKIFIKKSIHTFFVTNIYKNESEYDYEDLMDAKANADDEDTSLADFKKYISELTQ